MFGPYCKLIGGNHDYTYTKGALALNELPRAEQKEILIENGVWVGACTVILTGAHIGEGAVIGAMGLVNHFVPPYTIAVGVPAKRFFSRFTDDRDLEELLSNIGSRYTVEMIKRVQKTHAVQSRRG
jgi:acetyltransferase-like isoleucine patch superfamily enzyme